jgi:DHA1 family bicyclomycin/chloramphenicol resistance-like MFS transporter
MERLWLPFLLILSLVACCIEVDISVPGFPAMAHYFKISEGTIQLTVALNFLGFCLASLIHGPLSEGWGRRRVMVVGNAVLVAGAFGCAMAPSIEWLLAVRFIQGLGASTSAVIVFAMIADSYQGEKAIRLIGLMNSVLTILMAFAPVVGGFINKAIGWRGNYWGVAFISLLSWIFLYWKLPETKNKREILNVQNVIKDYSRLLTTLHFMRAALVPSMLYAAYMGFVASAAFLYMETYGLSILAYAVQQAVIVGSFAMTSIFSSFITRSLGAKKCVVLGSIGSVAGIFSLVVLSLLSLDSPLLVTSFMVLFCLGFAIYYPIIFSASLEIYPGIKGIASSLIMAMRALLVAAVVGIVGYFYDGTLLNVALILLLIVLIGAGLTVGLVRVLFPK